MVLFRVSVDASDPRLANPFGDLQGLLNNGVKLTYTTQT